MRLIFSALLVTLFASAAHAAPVLPFELRWMNHEDRTTTYKSSDHPNGIFVLETYFLNCPYCNDNAPAVDALVEEYAEQPRVQVLDVSRDCRESDYNTWINRHKPNHPVLNDCSKKVIGPLQVSGYPSTYVVDCKGNIVYRTAGAWNSNTKRAIRAKIDALLLEDCAAE